METPPPEFDPAITDFYQRAPEEDRLEQGPFLLEALRTRELIQRYAPTAPATVIDIGGAAGAYALWLAEAGYTVHCSTQPHVLSRKPVAGALLVRGLSLPATSVTPEPQSFLVAQPTWSSAWDRSII